MRLKQNFNKNISTQIWLIFIAWRPCRLCKQFLPFLRHYEELRDEAIYVLITSGLLPASFLAVAMRSQ